jgi:hypothetical protein
MSPSSIHLFNLPGHKVLVQGTLHGPLLSIHPSIHPSFHLTDPHGTSKRYLGHRVDMYSRLQQMFDAIRDGDTETVISHVNNGLANQPDKVDRPLSPYYLDLLVCLCTCICTCSHLRLRSLDGRLSTKPVSSGGTTCSLSSKNVAPLWTLKPW